MLKAASLISRAFFPGSFLTTSGRLVLLILALIGLASDRLAAGESQSSYQVAPNFPQLPEGFRLGEVSAVTSDSAGNVFIFHRGKHPIVVFTADGKYLRSFGDGLYDSAHGLRIDPEGNVWTTDNKNHTVVKLTPEGKVLLTLGERNVAGEDATHFNRPTDVTFAPDGSFFVSDGYGNSRVVKFDHAGKFLLAWGKRGTGPGEFHVPHAVQMDSAGHLFVADRENKRLQVFDQNGKYLREITGFAPYGLFITRDDHILIADGIANQALRLSLDGQTRTAWGMTGREPGNFLLPHGITAAKDGSLYVTEITGKRVQKFIPFSALK